jgi:hypothetical protein
MERHCCYSCRESHAFLTAEEWAFVEPAIRAGVRELARARRIARRLGREAAVDHRPYYQAALDVYNGLTGEVVTNGYSLLHRQLIHTCKYLPHATAGQSEHET